MKLIYKTEITSIGESASGFLEHEMFIIFKDNAPEDLKDYCFIHNENNLVQDIEKGDILFIGESQYKIISVGTMVNQNLNELGHITFKFNGDDMANIAGTLFLEKKEIVPPENGTILKVIRF